MIYKSKKNHGCASYSVKQKKVSNMILNNRTLIKMPCMAYIYTYIYILCTISRYEHFGLF